MNVHVRREQKENNPIKAVRGGSIILRFERPTSRKSAKSKLGRSRVCCDVKASQILTGNEMKAESGTAEIYKRGKAEHLSRLKADKIVLIRNLIG